MWITASFAVEIAYVIIPMVRKKLIRLKFLTAVKHRFFFYFIFFNTQRVRFLWLPTTVTII